MATASDDELAVKSDPQPACRMPLPSTTARSESSKYKHAKLFPEGWDTLSMKERLSGVKDRYVEDDPSCNAMHADWKDCVDELKLLEFIRQGMEVDRGEAAMLAVVMGIYKVACDVAADNHISQQLVSDKGKGFAKDQVAESAQGTKEVARERIFKLPIGNVEKEELPENLEENGYVRPRFLTTSDKIPLRTKYGSIEDDPELIIATSVPSAPVDDAFADSDGHCVWMTNAATKAKYFANKDWPKPLPKIPTKIAIRTGPHRTSALEELSENQIAQISLNHAEQFFKNMVDQQMTAEAKEGYMSLANSHKNDGSGPVFGIVRTNGFGIEFGEVVPGLDEDFRTGYAAVARIGSRFNHSCIPDVSAPGFDPVTFTMRFTALRDIKAGSQIHAAYTSITESKAERQKALASYGFECTCRACVNATPQSDKLRQVSVALTQKWRSQAINVWSKDLKLTERVLIPVLETRKRMEEEGLDVEEAGYFTFSEILHRVYKQVGNRAKEAEVEDELVQIAMGLLAAREWRTGAKVR
ncbi:hypothetical protein H1R20_g1715, partial [Candolleomyces eurysporus]